MSDTAGGDSHEPLHVIPGGGDVEAEGFDHTLTSDRIHILPGGIVELVHKSAYERTFIPLDHIQYMKTHTREYEEEDWW